MTTPAVEINEPAPMSFFGVPVFTYPGGFPYYTIAAQSQGHYFREDRPASSTSLKRADGTRPPREWGHAGMFRYAPVGQCDFVILPYGEEYRMSGPFHTPDASYLPIHVDNISQGLRDRALLKALLKLKDGKVNLSVMAAEARKTAGMLGRFATDMSRIVDTIRSKDLRRLGKLKDWKQIPGRYLEWCYGVGPLLQDIDGSMQAIAEAQNLNRPLRLKVVGIAEEKDLINLDPLSPWFGSNCRLEVECQRRKLVRYSLCYDVPSWALKDLSQLGLSNPLETLYELTPYSFVLDWVIPVGDWLSVLDAGAFLEFREGTLSQFITLKQSRIYFAPEMNPGIVMKRLRTSHSSVRGFSLARSVLIEKPIFAGIPRLKKPFQLDKLAKGLALLTQAFSRR